MSLNLFHLLNKESSDSLAKQLYSPFLVSIYKLGVVSVIAASILTLSTIYKNLEGLDQWAVHIVPMVLLCFLLVADADFLKQTKLSYFLPIVILSILLISVNWQHLASLFVPDLALPLIGSGEKPVRAIGWFGGELLAPGWHLQLRHGLLWSGVLGLLISVLFMVYAPSRAWMFLSINAVFVWIACSSPYIYTWLSHLTDYHSVWRLATLSFHPLIIGAMFIMLIDVISDKVPGVSKWGSLETTQND